MGRAGKAVVSDAERGCDGYERESLRDARWWEK